MFGVYLINSRAGMYTVIILFSTGAGLTRPILVTRVSKKSGKKHTGKFMGVLDSLSSISRIITPIIGGFIINNYYPGIIGIISGFLMFIALLVELKI